MSVFISISISVLRAHAALKVIMQIAVDEAGIWTACCACMKSITYTAARENLASTINRVCEDNAPVVITRKRDQAVVMLSLAEYESLQETAHLLRSPANAKRLLDSLEDIKRGKVIRKKINLDE